MFRHLGCLVPAWADYSTERREKAPADLLLSIERRHLSLFTPFSWADAEREHPRRTGTAAKSANL